MYPTCVSNGASDRQNAPVIEPLNAASQLFRVRVPRDIEKREPKNIFRSFEINLSMPGLEFHSLLYRCTETAI